VGRVVPYFSRAFGDQYAVVSWRLLCEKGLEDADRIIAHLDDVRPTSVVRFDTHEAAVRYLDSRQQREAVCPMCDQPKDRPARKTDVR
jgi:hypothetical protein